MSCIYDESRIPLEHDADVKSPRGRTDIQAHERNFLLFEHNVQAILRAAAMQKEP